MARQDFDFILYRNRSQIIGQNRSIENGKITYACNLLDHAVKSISPRANHDKSMTHDETEIFKA